MGSNQYIDVQPRIDPSAFVALSADLIGAVTIHKDASVWFQVVMRADDEPITIGEGSNVQDGSILHIDPGCPTTLGKFVTVGHKAIVHGAQIADHVMVSMGAILLSGARIGEHAIIGAGALVTEGMEVPPNSLVLGVPGRIVKTVTEAQIERIHQTAQGYIERGRVYAERAKWKR
ncbi:MAG: gamma carbonic anhydrase family protein [candidate division Zixibacteria bacterium]|nr:gamma carbonic anhydrase family protein [candidate division Zixibacteria bacterium]